MLVNDVKLSPNSLVDPKTEKNAVHLAVEKSEVLILYFFGEMGLNMSPKDSEGNTPLHYAISNNQVFIARFLLAMNADIAATNDELNTPLH